MNTRRATIQDLESIAYLFDQYRIFYGKKPDIAAAKAYLNERISNIESVIFLAVNSSDETTGFVQLYPIFSSTRMKKIWLLNDLFVEKRFRGQGFSKALIEASKELCRYTDACGLILETAKSNVAGNKLYPNTGFSLDTAHNYYSWDS